MKTQHRNTLNLRHVENLEEKLATYHILKTHDIQPRALRRHVTVRCVKSNGLALHTA